MESIANPRLRLGLPPTRKGRALKGIAKRLGVTFSLANRWADGCRLTVNAAASPTLPLWGKDIVRSPGSGIETEKEKVRFRQVGSVLKEWSKGKTKRFVVRTLQKLPPKMKNWALEYIVEKQDRKDQKD